MSSPTRYGRTSPGFFQLTSHNEPKVARKVRIYKNGDQFFSGSALTINPRTTRGLDVFMDQVTSTLRGGPVHRLYTPVGGTRVKSLADLQNGKAYVAAPKARFKPMEYESIMDLRAKATRYKAMKSTSPSPKKKYQYAGRRSLNTLMGGGRAKCIFLVRNGDSTCKYVNLVLTKRNTMSWNQLCDNISERMRMDTAVRQIYSIAGDRVDGLEGLTDGGTYVTVGRGRFKQMGYRPAPPLHAATTRILPPISRSPPKRTSPKKRKPVVAPTPPPKPPPKVPPVGRGRSLSKQPAPPPPKPAPPPKVRPQSYTVRIATLPEQGAGTSAQVTVSIFGTKGSTGPRLLNEDPDNFGTAADDVFAIDAMALGEIQKIVLEHDSSGAESSWKVGRISVRDALLNVTKYFHVNKWLANDRAPFDTRVEIMASDDPNPPTAADTDGALAKDIFATEAKDSDADEIEDDEDTQVDVPVEMQATEKVDGSDDEADTDAGEEGGRLPDPESEGKEKAAAVLIQANFRGFKVRRALKIKQEAVLELQAAFRGFAARREAAQMTAALTAMKKSHAPMASLSEDDAAERAATALQSAWRGRQARKLLEEKQEAALEIQAAIRGYQARKELGKLTAEETAEEAPDDEEVEEAHNELETALKASQVKPAPSIASGSNETSGGPRPITPTAEETAAAIKIQANVRGMQARKQYQQKKAGDEDISVDEAAAILEGAMLGAKARADAKEKILQQRQRQSEGEPAGDEDISVDEAAAILEGAMLGAKARADAKEKILQQQQQQLQPGEEEVGGDAPASFGLTREAPMEVINSPQPEDDDLEEDSLDEVFSDEESGADDF